jgi:hypothetical protein
MVVSSKTGDGGGKDGGGIEAGNQAALKDLSNSRDFNTATALLACRSSYTCYAQAVSYKVWSRLITESF